MKLMLNQCPHLTETEVEIRYMEMNTQIEKLARRVEQEESYLYGEENGQRCRILTDNILYAESIDRKTFIYTERLVYRSELKLQQLLNQVKHMDFVQVNKSCILNINVLEHVKTLLNSRMEGTLTNGEKIIISRTYLPAIKAAFTRKEGRSE